MKRKKRFAAAALLIAAAITFGTQRAYHAYLVSLDYADPPKGMVLVPPGDFIMGTDNPEASQDEKPTRKRFLPAFYIDTYEVTNAEFHAFDPTHAFAKGKEDIPATGIALQEARDYAQSVGKRLPTLAEWEKAARGTDGRDYPWGNEFRDGIANINRQQGLTAVGTHPKSVSPYGAHDMIGNAWEWVADSSNHRIQKFDSFGTFLTEWGSDGSDDGEFHDSTDVALDASGNVYIADATNDRVQKFN